MTAALASGLATALAPTGLAQVVGPMPSGKAFHPVEIDFTALGPGGGTGDWHQDWTGGHGTQEPNPWLHCRLTGVFSHNLSGDVHVVPGFFNGDGAGYEASPPDPGGSGLLGAGVGKIWSVRFAPPRSGDWTVNFYWESDSNINVADLASYPLNSSSTVVTDIGRTLVAEPFDASAPGFLGKGLLRVDDTSTAPYLRFVRHLPNGKTTGPYYMKTGLGSPENLLGYVGFTGLDVANHASPDMDNDSPATFGVGFVHDYKVSYPVIEPTGAQAMVDKDHATDWPTGAPNWSANGLEDQGKGIIGALTYLADQGINALYMIPMNLGGDGRDAHPFAGLVPTGQPGAEEYPSERPNVQTTRVYDVKRMREWNRTFEYCMEVGLLANFVLAEQEIFNMEWLADDPVIPTDPPIMVGISRKLFLKNMVAFFGHNVAVQWTLCEENGDPAPPPPAPAWNEFTFEELEDMAQWILQWDSFDHPITVHPRVRTRFPNDPYQFRHGTEFFKALVDSASGRGQWLDVASLYVQTTDPNGLTVNPDDRDNYSTEPEIVLSAGRMGGNDWGYNAGRKFKISFVDEHGGWRYGVAPVVSDLPAGTQDLPTALSNNGERGEIRRRMIYDVLLSGSGLGLYFGWALEPDSTPAPNEYYELEAEGGNDITCDHFASRQSVFEDLKRAREIITDHMPFWRAKPNDAALTGSPYVDARYGAPEVFEFRSRNDHTFIIYYPVVQTEVVNDPPLGEIALSGSGSGGQVRPWTWKWIDPATGAVLSSGNATSGTLVIRPLLPPNPLEDQDMVLVLEAQDAMTEF